MKQKILIIVLAVVVIITGSCKDDGTGPENLEPGRRDYTWTVDTLNMPMNFISAIWGSSPNDVWTVGGGGEDEDRLLHYDGNKWSTYKNESILCTGETIYGFSADNVWMGGGNDGRIWHYDGNKWSENYRYIVEGAYNVGINDIWGTQPNDVYACGITTSVISGITRWQGFILHFNGYTWQEVVRVSFNSQFIKIRSEQNKTYVFAIRRSAEISDTISFYQLNGNELKEIYSASEEEITFGNFVIIDNQLYFWISNTVYFYRNNTFIKQFSIDNPNWWYYIFGRNSKDIFVSMRNGLAHYNGMNIEYLFKYPNIYHKIIGGEPATFEKELFIGFYDMNLNKNLILHGKLKE